MNASMGRAESQIRRARPQLGTLVDISAAAANPETAEQAVCEAFAAVAEVQRLMSYHDPLSEVSQLNHEAQARPVQVSDWTYEVLSLAQTLSAESDGAFDVTVAPRLASWGYLPRIPARRRRGRLATWRDIDLRPGNTVAFHRPLHIDLGGIAKGFAVDQAIAALRRAGATAGCVNAGGDLRVFGPEPVPIHIRHPARPAEMARSLSLIDSAMATSASYFSRKRWRRCWVCPLVDGRTRQPCDDESSATVVTSTAAIADALTKIVLASREAASPILTRYQASAFILDRQGQCAFLPANDAP